MVFSLFLDVSGHIGTGMAEMQDKVQESSKRYSSRVHDKVKVVVHVQSKPCPEHFHVLGSPRIPQLTRWTQNCLRLSCPHHQNLVIWLLGQECQGKAGSKPHSWKQQNKGLMLGGAIYLGWRPHRAQEFGIFESSSSRPSSYFRRASGSAKRWRKTGTTVNILLHWKVGD